jgi:hypothetical protein
MKPQGGSLKGPDVILENKTLSIKMPIRIDQFKNKITQCWGAGAARLSITLVGA